MAVSRTAVTGSGSLTAALDQANDTVTIGADHEYTLSTLASVSNRKVGDETLTLHLHNTSLTHFGAWKIVDSTDPSNLQMSRGVFAYSQLALTDYGTNGNYLPLRGSAQYAGWTRAVDTSDKLYSGNYRLSVTWSASGGTISAAISGLSGFTLGGQTVTQIGFQDTLDDVSGNPDFTSPDSTTVQYATGSQGVAPPQWFRTNAYRSVSGQPGP